MADYFSKIRVSSALDALKKVAIWPHNTLVDNAKDVNPLIRMYYDSDLGSPIETVVEQAYSGAAYARLKVICPNWQPALNACESIGAWIAHKKVQALDVSKLFYQVTKGIITADKAYSEIAKRTTAGLFTVGKIASRALHVVGKATRVVSDAILDEVPEDVRDHIKQGVDLVVGETLRNVRKKIFSDESKKAVTNFVERGLRTAHTGIRKAIEVADRVVEKAGIAVDHTVEFVQNVAHKLGEEIKPFKEKVANSARTIGESVKAGANKLLSIIRSWF